MTEERLALSELLEKGGDGDFLRAVAEAVLQLLMEADVEGLIGAGRYERSGERSTQRHPDAAVIVPPRSSAVPSATAETAPTKRDRHLQLIAERGRMGWQRAPGYNWRALVEADIGPG